MFIFAQSLAHALLVIVIFHKFVMALQHYNMFYYAKTTVHTTRCLIDEPDVEFNVHLNIPFFLRRVVEKVIWQSEWPWEGGKVSPGPDGYSRSVPSILSWHYVRKTNRVETVGFSFQRRQNYTVVKRFRNQMVCP